MFVFYKQNGLLYFSGKRCYDGHRTCTPGRAHGKDIRLFMKKLLRVAALLLTLCLPAGALSAPVRADDIADVEAMIDSIPEDWPAAPAIGAETAVLLDADSGEVLYAKNALQAMYPASTTKLITALLALENCSLTDVIPFSARAVNIPANSSHIAMRRGEKMVLRECLYGLLLPSANEVANALAEYISGSIRTFVVRMNERAYQLGAVNTVFTNANGLHEADHYTCAYDLAKIMAECVRNNVFREIASAPSYVHHSDELLPKDIPMTNTNMMIRSSSEYYNPDVVCGKTGHTDESGYNLVTYAEHDGTRLVACVMGCESGNQYVSTQSLLDYGFKYFHKVLPAELDDSLSMNNLFTASPLAIPTPDVPLLTLDTTDGILLPDNVTFDMLDKTVEDLDDGKLIRYSYQGYPLGNVRLAYAGDAEKSPIYADGAEEALKLDTPEPLVTVDARVIIYLGVLALLLFIVIRVQIGWILPKRKYR